MTRPFVDSVAPIGLPVASSSVNTVPSSNVSAIVFCPRVLEVIACSQSSMDAIQSIDDHHAEKDHCTQQQSQHNVAIHIAIHRWLTL
jgi:hypothetical protein